MQITKRILVAPLDWGLGHTSRCVPIIKELQAQHAKVIVAGNPQQIDYLKNEVDDVSYIDLDGYAVKYAKTKLGLILSILLQMPKLFFKVIQEHSWLQIIIHSRKIDGVISDNRFGLFTKKVPCIFITHQLVIPVPIGKSMVHRINQYFIKQYNECWLPDADGDKSISGALSITSGYKNVKKIGVLSRFLGIPISVPSYKKKSILCILSGPEPQRSMLLAMIENQIYRTDYYLTIVGDAFAPTRKTNSAIAYYKVVDSITLQLFITQHQYIITRSGYSSLMDLQCLGRNAILIPTPGQTEQEYLGGYVMNKNWHFTSAQKDFNLQKCIEAFDKMTFEKVETDTDNNLAKAVNNFLKQCEH